MQAALSYLRENAHALNIDETRFALVAVSAGGPLLSMAMRDKPSYVRCLVALAAFLDIQQSDLHRQHEPLERVRAFAPITYLDADAKRIAPLFIARGGADEIPTLNDSIDRFTARALETNAAVTLINHPIGDHTFVTQKDDARSREVIRSVIEFLKYHLVETPS